MSVEDSLGQKSGMNIDSALLREIAELLNSTGLSEIEVADGDRKIRVARNLQTAVSIPLSSTPVPVASAPQATPAAAAAAATDPVVEGNAIRSPMVGTVYLASEPTAPPFVSIGQTVKAGDTLLIIEAMKVMNPITAPAGGTVMAILVDNAQPVEFDQPLLVIA